jgi:hypothetical protein
MALSRCVCLAGLASVALGLSACGEEAGLQPGAAAKTAAAASRIQYLSSWSDTLARAKAESKPILLNFGGPW